MKIQNIISAREVTVKVLLVRIYGQVNALIEYFEKRDPISSDARFLVSELKDIIKTIEKPLIEKVEDDKLETKRVEKKEESSD